MLTPALKTFKAQYFKVRAGGGGQIPPVSQTARIGLEDKKQIQAEEADTHS